MSKGRVTKEDLEALGLRALATKYDEHPPKYNPNTKSPVYTSEYRNSTHRVTHPDVAKAIQEEKDTIKARVYCILALSKATLRARTCVGPQATEEFTEDKYKALVKEGENIALYGLNTYDKGDVKIYWEEVGAILDGWNNIGHAGWKTGDHKETLVAYWLKAKNCWYLTSGGSESDNEE